MKKKKNKRIINKKKSFTFDSKLQIFTHLYNNSKLIKKIKKKFYFK